MDNGSNAEEVVYYVTMVGVALCLVCLLLQSCACDVIQMYGVGKTAIITKLRNDHFVKKYTPTQDKKIVKHTLGAAVKSL